MAEYNSRVCRFTLVASFAAMGKDFLDRVEEGKTDRKEVVTGIFNTIIDVAARPATPPRTIEELKTDTIELLSKRFVQPEPSRRI